jgi:hypothetical protein
VTNDPKRLTVVGATDLERTLLQAGRGERPSPELTARMAAGLGISAAAAVTAAAPAAAAAAPAAAAVKTTALAAWVPAGVIALAVAAGVVAVRVASPPVPPAPVSRPAPAAIAAPQAEVPIAEPAPDIITEKRIEKIRRRPAPPPPAGDLRDQIALVDAARTAVKSGATERALTLLRRYEATYPGGAFRPEVLALRIETLDDAGRGAEARALAREFLARYPQSPVADRVARVADPK